MQSPSPNVMPQSHLMQVLNYLKMGHPVLPTQPIKPIPLNLSPVPQPGQMTGHLPIGNPTQNG